MSNLKYWQDKIKEKRRQTSFRDFIKDIGTWLPLVFYKNNSFISRYHESDRVKVCDINDFDEVNSDLIEKGVNYKYELSFFDNYKILLKLFYLPALNHYWGVENSNYSDSIVGSKSVYLSNLVIIGCENVFYSIFIRENCSNIYNSVNIIGNNDIIHFSSGVNTSFKVFYSRYIINSNNIWFSSNLTGCKECIFCDDLQNISYCINNKEYSKEEYLLKKKDILSKKEKFIDYYLGVNKNGNNQNSTNVLGGFLNECSFLKNAYGCNNINNGRNVLFSGSPLGNENFFDVMPGGGGGGDDFYGVNGAGQGSQNLFCCSGITKSSNIYYSYFLENCSYCLGCIGLKNKSYCILNKQYSKEEWEKLSDKIFSQMEEEGTLGGFFPGNLNPFYFNDTMAYLLDDSFTKEEVESEGYMWRDEEIKVDIPKNADIISTDELQDFEGFDENGKRHINPEILKKVIKDKKGNYYRIVKMEYDFLVKHGLPLPENHWLDRIKLGFQFN